MPSSLTTDQLAVTLQVDASEAVVSARGEVDHATAPALGRILHLSIELCAREVRLDLSAVSFIDAGGLAVIAAGASQLGASGGRQLTLVGTTDQTRRLLHITGMASSLRIDEHRRPSRSPSPPIAISRGDPMTDPSEPAFGPPPFDVGPIAAASIADARLETALELLAALTTRSLPGADGASVAVRRAGHLTTVATSNDTVARMDGHQYATGEGPCLAAAAQGQVFEIDSLADDDRWPAFVDRAMDEGIASILSVPLPGPDQPLGSLNIYSAHERAFAASGREIADGFASETANLLLAVHRDPTHLRDRNRIAEGLHARNAIALAQGVLMAREGCNPDEAADLLARSAREAQHTMLAEAEAVVASLRGGPTGGSPIA